MIAVEPGRMTEAWAAVHNSVHQLGSPSHTRMGHGMSRAFEMMERNTMMRQEAEQVGQSRREKSLA